MLPLLVMLNLRTPRTYREKAAELPSPLVVPTEPRWVGHAIPVASIMRFLNALRVSIQILCLEVRDV